MIDKHEEISYRAYMKWCAAGSPPCSGKEFWYEAEKEIEVVSIEDMWDEPEFPVPPQKPLPNWWQIW